MECFSSGFHIVEGAFDDLDIAVVLDVLREFGEAAGVDGELVAGFECLIDEGDA